MLINYDNNYSYNLYYNYIQFVTAGNRIANWFINSWYIKRKLTMPTTCWFARLFEFNWLIEASAYVLNFYSSVCHSKLQKAF